MKEDIWENKEQGTKAGLDIEKKWALKSKVFQRKKKTDKK